MKLRLLVAGTSLLALGSIWGLAPTQVQDQNQPERLRPEAEYQGGPLVSVSATGRISTAPNRASVSLGATAQAKTAAAAVEKVNSTMSELIDQLKALELPGARIQTSSVQLYPVYGPHNGIDQPRIVAYQASNSVSVRTDDVASIASVLDLAVRVGANQINGPVFELQNSDRVQREALRLAVAEARSKAEVIAEAMNMKIVCFEEVSEVASISPSPMLYGGDVMAMREAVSTPVEVGEIETSATVTLVARLSE
ncbi:MAG: SIMPL domain-containing protein [Phycisphaerales bacterium]|nr:SIMPL domain-containing protein [Phycisphaerales bacterium]